MGGSEYLCLLISSLEDYDSTTTKYIIPGIPPRKYSDEYIDKGKVNYICGALRKALLVALDDGNDKALNPVLCTLACQRPANLIEALKVWFDVSRNVLYLSTSTSTICTNRSYVRPVEIISKAPSVQAL